ncbi:uncharacterized protein BO88DRAFT_3779 [Aspergillus vadensis CBS 113365]|uniref:Secreted protein n=1 Tax=Aspergillus vadensis (strain CBS 113365 / IMI 142717 / IBT 24658) TaxID=1448311 RepID=A0A319BP58_ASPVC|nr:hypothetical protein BO88DRAFT_3779 [Aspergillus vadensis CBS 113365]PYH74144.1 hypothetical protein BO88DRAFT_3779 [Aspergillus vadensis CBS 113365]
MKCCWLTLSGLPAMMSLGLLQPGIRNRNFVRLFLVSDGTGTGNGSNPHAIPNPVLGHRPQKGRFPRIISRAKLNFSSFLIRLENKEPSTCRCSFPWPPRQSSLPSLAQLGQTTGQIKVFNNSRVLLSLELCCLSVLPC